MSLPVAIAIKLLRLLHGEPLPESALKYELVREMISEGIIMKRVAGRTRGTLYITDSVAATAWLHNRFGISNLEDYVHTIQRADATKADLAIAANDSKAAVRRSFQGFLVNTFEPVQCTLSDKPLIVYPVDGTFLFVSDFHSFRPPADAVVVGVENMENFRFVAQQKRLFYGMKALFVSRFPQVQSRDLLRWLQSIPNRYLHFGDFDPAGINIYLSEFKGALGSRASFFVPRGIDKLLNRYGSRRLFDQQKPGNYLVDEEPLRQLMALINEYGKGLEQEVLIKVPDNDWNV